MMASSCLIMTTFLKEVRLSKTAGIPRYASLPEALSAAEQREYLLCEVGTGYRFCKTLVSSCMAGNSSRMASYFKWHLPKVPTCVFNAIRDFFGMVNDEYHTEAQADIWYSVKRNCYFVFVPPQAVSTVSVFCDDMTQMQRPGELVRVVTLHSHNTMPPFFSSTDNADEGTNIVSVVFGNYQKGEPDFLVRSNVDGEHRGAIAFSAVFEDGDDVNDYEHVTPASLMADFAERATIMGGV